MPGTGTTRRGLIVGAAGTLGSFPGLAEAGPATPEPSVDGGGRLTVPVMLNGQGPFTFAVDSAANASVVAQDVAARLGLTDSGRARMHTLLAHEEVATVRVARLVTGAIDAADRRLMLAPRFGLGVDGLIGTDLLAGHRLNMDFRMGRIGIGRSRIDMVPFFHSTHFKVSLLASDETRRPDLLMLNARGPGGPLKAMIDTGAQVSVINTALARQAGAFPIVLRNGATVEAVRSPTGLSMDATPMLLPYFQLSGTTMVRLPVLVGDFHIFDLWGLRETPAMLMGVDIMARFRQVMIDLGRAELILEA